MIVCDESDIGEPAFRPLSEFKGGDAVRNRAGHTGLVLDRKDDIGRLAWFHTGIIWWQENPKEKLFRKISAKVVASE